MKDNIKIANQLTANDWQKLEPNLKVDNNLYWGISFNFFEQRIKTRYLNPINAILDLQHYTGEGFAVVNLQCSLIETIECFINGWRYIYPYFLNNKDEKFKKNEKIFISFFKQRNPFNECEIDGKDFYKNVRCGLLHETQTKNNWKIKYTNKATISYVEEDGFKLIYRNNFQRDIEVVISKYKSAIINGKNFDNIKSSDLRENFKAKFNHICKQSTK